MFAVSVTCRSPLSVSPAPESDLDEVEVAASPAIVPGILLLVAIGYAVDLALDRPAKWLSLHVLVELTLMIVSLAFSIVLWRGWRHTQGRLVRTEATLARSEAERDTWRKSAESALITFTNAVEQQLTRWSLTPAEREVALLLLKGYGHKQIAARTGRSERTVRQHAVAVYDKSGLGGRAELAAFFLEGLIVPPSIADDGLSK
jgi:DNA-binding CsgD family transcriptional regulator